MFGEATERRRKRRSRRVERENRRACTENMSTKVKMGEGKKREGTWMKRRRGLGSREGPLKNANNKIVKHKVWRKNK